MPAKWERKENQNKKKIDYVYYVYLSLPIHKKPTVEMIIWKEQSTLER